MAMTITLDHESITEALIEYVSNQGINLSDADTSVRMTAGRGANGYSAEVLIEKKNSKPSQVTVMSDFREEQETVAPEEVTDNVLDEVQEVTEEEDTPASIFTS